MIPLVRLYEPFIYGVVFSGIITAAALLLHSDQYGYYGRSLYSLIYNTNVSRLRRSMASLLNNESNEQLFREAGNPLGLTGLAFSFLRITALLAGITLALFKWVINSTTFPLSTLILYVLFYYLSSTGKFMPVRYLLKKLKQINKRDKNRECFLLYSMLLNEFYIEEEKPYNMYAVLLRMSNYFNAIKPALYKTLAVWKRNPSLAMDFFASEVGTEEARDLAQIIKSVDTANTSDARDIIRGRYEQFQTNRHEQHRRILKNVDLAGYIVVFVPTIAVLFNMVFVMGLAVQNLLLKVNYH